MHTNPVGTGPYTVKEFISGSKIVLEADDNYWQTDDSLKSFRQLQNVQHEYTNCGEPAQHVIALQTGDMDYSEIIPQESLASFDEGGEFSDSYKVHPASRKTMAACSQSK